MKFNIVPLIGKKDTYPKDDVKKNFPKWKKVDFYTDPIPKDANTMMMTGIHPLYPTLQIVVLDFDGMDHKAVGWSGLTRILHAVRKVNLEPYMIRKSGNGGFHLIYICDIEEVLRNEHKKGLSDDAIDKFGNFVEDIDVRANGGLVFWDCKFTDTDEYITITEQDELNITSSVMVKEFVDSLRKKEIIKTGTKPVLRSKIKSGKVKAGIEISMYNCKEYGIPEKHFHKYNVLRRAVKDIWTGTYIIDKGYNEFRKWGVFWRECLSRGIPEYVILNRLRSGVQPEYDEEDTLTQLKCLRFRNITPKSEYYFSVFPSYA